MTKNLLIAIAFTLMLINPSITIAAESPLDIQEVLKRLVIDNFLKTI